MSDTFRGIFAILKSPFHEDGRLDEASLESEVEFSIEAGTHGIVWPVMASQFAVLSHAERKRSNEIVLRKAGGRIPMVIGVATVWTEASVELAQHAERHGADAIISLPPWEVKPTREQAFDYYRTLSEAVSIPIFIQNAGGKFGLGLPADDIARMVGELEGVDYVKEETQPLGQTITKILAACGDTVKGVFGGAGCKHLIAELHRGSAGNMPANEICDVMAEIYDRYTRGDEAGAREVYNAMLVYQNFHGLRGGELGREILRRRGVISSAAPRFGRGLQLDAHDERELEVILEGLKPYFRVRPPIG